MSLEDEGTQDAEGMEEYIMKQVGQLINEETGDLEWEPLQTPVETVTKLDVERYGGRWYQVRMIQAMTSPLAWPRCSMTSNDLSGGQKLTQKQKNASFCVKLFFCVSFKGQAKASLHAMRDRSRP